MKAIFTILLGAGLIASFTGCGGGGGYDDTTVLAEPTLVERVSYYPNGMIIEKGLVQTGTDIQEGEWWSYYNEASATQWGGINQKPKWRRWFKTGVWVQDEPWREWNQDGSIRDDYTDAMATAP
jgi:hypothetical protein